MTVWAVLLITAAKRGSRVTSDDSTSERGANVEKGRPVTWRGVGRRPTMEVSRAGAQQEWESNPQGAVSSGRPRFQKVEKLLKVGG